MPYVKHLHNYSKSRKACPMHKQNHVPAGMKEIITPYITNWRTGKRVYPKNARFFRFLVPIDDPRYS
jgi:hypothetical protein